MSDFNEEQNRTIRNNIATLRGLYKIPNDILCSKLYISERTLQRLLKGESDWDKGKVDKAAEFFGLDSKEIIGEKAISIEALDTVRVNKEGCAMAVIYIASYLKALPGEQSIQEMVEINNRIISQTVSNLLHM